MARLSVPEPLRGLTTRGRCFLAAGAACLGSSVALGEDDLLHVGVFLVALPLVAAVLVARTRYRLACTRELDPSRVPVGTQAQVRIRLDNVSRLPTSVLLMEDQLPYTLGSRPRFVLDRVEAGGHRQVSYPVRADNRGRYKVGPLGVRLSDPFGCCELPRSFASVDELIVTPLVSPLPEVRLGGEWTGGGDQRARSVASSGENDVGTRTYRRGDDLRKVHWKATARAGELMVRQEQQPWQSRAVLVVDSRLDAHFGDGPGSSFEWCVSAAASIGSHLLRRGYALRLLGTSSAPLTALHSTGADALLLDQLAVAALTQQDALRASLDQLRSSGAAGNGLVVAVLGAMEVHESTDWSRLPHGSGAGIAVLVDTASWASLPPKLRAETAASHRRAQASLAAAGWRVLPVTHGQTIASVWPMAAARSSAAPLSPGGWSASVVAR